ncbi:hypothetical protein GCM10010329_47640 [Streptomyces spiroverticillatus]|uniref:Uncharacterized protein n=1 Tax=Streptomyces finlayi TaxID=67296 RepID=A0A918X0Y8_9ACTN|nr:hypothetical protein GCM10010329_47640 [Streptomyces spiroverticillatus]GHD02247.1 hypothetical protein GCM10010334_48590 [Streptomyces finlayi]
MTAESGCRWPVPPQDGYTVDDLFTLPEDLKVEREMTVVLDRRNGPEPDL